MQRPNRPAYWQLDVFMLLMIGLMLLALWAEFPASWYSIIEIAWPALTIAGMVVWVRANWATLQSEERKQRTANKGYTRSRPNELERTIPLTSVQKQFLTVMESANREMDS
jgi:hypothetical protein